MSLICPFFKKGICRFGNRCRNSHNVLSRYNDEREENRVQTSRTATIERQQINRANDMNLRPKLNRGSSSSNSKATAGTDSPSKETIKDNEQNVQLLKKLSLAEKEIKVLNQKLQNQCRRGNLPCTEHNDFQLNDKHLHCSICRELFIKPMLLNCSHTFCEWCIETWSSVNSNCPICREFMLYKTHCLDLNHYIKKIVELGPSEINESYKLLEEEREREGPRDIEPDFYDNNGRFINSHGHPFDGYYVI